MTTVQAATTPSDLLQALHWRYAVKKFDATKKIPAETWKALEEALILTPSSWGIQPWKFIVITDQPTKDKLVAASWRQRQVADASHVVVFAIKKDLNAQDVDKYIKRAAEVQNVPLESLDGFKKILDGFVEKPPMDINHWSARQLYIAIGNFMTAAAVIGIDTCPMEGIVPAKYDEILGLAAEGYAAQVVCVAGTRSPDDKYAASPKVRYKSEDVIKHI